MSSHLPEDTRLPEAFVQAWRDDSASTAEVRRAYMRFLQRRPTRGRVPALQVVGWMLAGMLLGMSGVYAATGGPWKELWFRAPKPAESVAPVRERVPRRDAPKVSAEAPEEPAAAPSNSPRSAPVAAAGARPSPSEHWRRAVRGLRDRDFDSASAALLELEAHAGPAERETAQLVRAQLLLSQGRGSEARLLLQTLQSSARSAVVRQKASLLFERSEKSDASQRSFPTPEVTNLP